MGYVSACKRYCLENNLNFNDFLKADTCDLCYMVHGKDNINFHTIIFPSLLLAVDENYKLPTDIVSSEYLTLNGDKISKSTGNYEETSDIVAKGSSDTLRFFILTNHYRMPVEFSDEALQAAANGVKRMLNAKQTKINESLDLKQLDEYKDFVNAMDDDMNTSKALAVLFDLTNKANKDVDYAFTLLHKLATTLGFTFEKAQLSEEELAEKLSKISAELGETYASMDEIIAKRKEAREAKNWDIADKIRIALDNVGIILKDSKEGTTWEAK